LLFFFFFFILLPPPRSTLFPYTTLFRSVHGSREADRDARHSGMALVLFQEPGSRSEPVSRTRLVYSADEVEEYAPVLEGRGADQDRKSTRLNSSHDQISYAVFCLKKKKK